LEFEIKKKKNLLEVEDELELKLPFLDFEVVKNELIKMIDNLI
jgi:hypothetical protein